MIKTVPVEKAGGGTCTDNYFHSFVKDCIRELESRGETIVFSVDHVDYIKSVCKNVNVTKTKDNFFKLTIDNIK